MLVLDPCPGRKRETPQQPCSIMTVQKENLEKTYPVVFGRLSVVVRKLSKEIELSLKSFSQTGAAV